MFTLRASEKIRDSSWERFDVNDVGLPSHRHQVLNFRQMDFDAFEGIMGVKNSVVKVIYLALKLLELRINREILEKGCPKSAGSNSRTASRSAER